MFLTQSPKSVPCFAAAISLGQKGNHPSLGVGLGVIKVVNFPTKPRVWVL